MIQKNKEPQSGNSVTRYRSLECEIRINDKRILPQSASFVHKRSKLNEICNA